MNQITQRPVKQADLVPATKAQIGERIAVLFAALPSQEKGESEELRARAYLYALDGYPVQVIDGVIRDVLQGRIPDIEPIFVPTPPQLSRVCRLRTERLREEQHRATTPKAIAYQHTPDEAECKRIAAKIDALKAQLIRTANGDALRMEMAEGVSKSLDALAEKSRARTA